LPYHKPDLRSRLALEIAIHSSLKAAAVPSHQILLQRSLTCKLCQQRLLRNCVKSEKKTGRWWPIKRSLNLAQLWNAAIYIQERIRSTRNAAVMKNTFICSSEYFSSSSSLSSNFAQFSMPKS